MENKSKLTSSYTLSDGTTMPSLGLGTSKGNKEAVIQAVMQAGYVHLDTASVYGNEAEIGEALQECYKQGKTREDIYITTKIDNGEEWNDPEGAIRRSLSKLQTDHVDLYLIHWPSGYYAKPTPKPLHVMWAEMESLVEKGLTKSIGVSNFNTQLLWDLLTYAKIPPAVNQIELNVLN